MLSRKRKIAAIVAALIGSALLVWFLVSEPSPPGKMPLAAWKALRGAEQLELLSLDPTHDMYGPGPRKEAPNGRFHDYRILGRTAIADDGARKALVDALTLGVKENEGMAAGCFDPRHGLRLTHKGQTVDLVICFHCYQVETFIDDEEMKGFLVSRSPQPIFDQVLRAAGVELPPPAKD
jgi:hypothetical protein